MITKAQVKHIRSLDSKKIRVDMNEFVVEGVKMVDELLKSQFKPIQLYATSGWIESNKVKLPTDCLIYSCLPFELERMSFLSTPNEVLAIVQLPKHQTNKVDSIALVLDSVQDPGNMGSIIRIADWYGIKQIFVNTACADAFSPKVVQSTMGSIFRVKIIETDLATLFETEKTKPIYAAVLEGKSLNDFPKLTNGFIVMGNESKGVQADVIAKATHKITIPRIGEAESLNVAVATGIICHVLLS